MRIAVFFGLNFKILNLTLPIFEPNKSPNVEINPPSNRRKIINIHEDTFLNQFIDYLHNN